VQRGVTIHMHETVKYCSMGGAAARRRYRPAPGVPQETSRMIFPGACPVARARWASAARSSG
jgi:hypothetical protein